MTTTAVSITNYGGDIQIEYSGAKTGDNEYIAVLLEDSSGNPTYYGRSAALTKASGTVTIPVAAGLTAGDAILYVYNEQYNGDKMTDLASELKSVSLTVAEAATYTVTYAPGANGTGTASTATKVEDISLALAGESFARTGYTQTGWATVDGGEKVYDLGAIYEENAPITLYPVWTANQYTVTLDSNGGGAVMPSTVTVTYGEDCPAIPVLQWAGHIFYGWYDAQAGGKRYVDGNGNSTARYDKTENCTLYAIWSDAPLCTVTFDPNGGILAGKNTSEQRSNDSIQYKPDDPTREGHFFLGWYQDSACTQRWDFDDWVTGDMTLYAGWRILDYIIYFDTAGGSDIGHITQDYGTAITAPAAPIKNGYTFIGWAPELPPTMPAKVMTVTAQWKINQYTIAYDLGGGTAEGNPDTYTVETDAFTLKNPTRPGYTFTGWSGTGLTGENNMTVTIPKGSTSEHSYTAHWRYNGGSSGGSSSYPITVLGKTENGTVTVSPRSAEKGDSVTITVKPDSGYQLDDLAVTDKNGKELKLTDKGNGKYTFTMPSGKVKINATFTKEAEPSPFSDVSTSAYYYEAVKWAQEKGITGGIGNGLFGPNQLCTRGQIVTFLWRAAGSPVVNYAMNMTDVAEDAYYGEAVRWALSEGITTGIGDTVFGPDAACTRAQAVTFLFRYAAANGMDAVTLADLISGFADAASVPGYAVSAMNWALSQGIMKGSGTQLLSGNTCTRAQIVTFLWRMYTEK